MKRSNTVNISITIALIVYCCYRLHILFSTQTAYLPPFAGLYIVITMMVIALNCNWSHRILSLVGLIIFHLFLVYSANDTSAQHPNLRIAFNFFIVLNTIAFGYIYDLNSKLRIAIREKEQAEKSQREQYENLQETKKALEEAMQEVQTANHAKSAFIANTNHELRTPLNIILGHCQILQENPSFPLEYREDIKVIRNSGEYLLSLINNILELSKIEAGKSVIYSDVFNLRKLLSEVYDMFALKAQMKSLQLIFDVNLKTDYFDSDSIKIKQILVNMIDNAIKFTQTGTVRVCVSCDDDRITNDALASVQFEISDTGVGIAPQELEQAFSAFYQTQSGKSLKQGTGLGLSISRNFIQLLGGEIQLQSELGRGTTFRFCLALKTCDAPKDLQIPLENSVSTIIRALIVDDQKVNRNILRIFLKPLKFEIREAKDGKEAVDIWKSWQPHIVFMDIMMPVMDGYQAVREIRKEDQETVVIALTASSLEEDYKAVLAAGCNECLAKPYRKQQIFDTIAKFLKVSE